MKRILFAAIAASAMIVACQKTEENFEQSDAHELHASIEADGASKTVLDENNNIRWSEGDQLVAFMKTSLGLKYQLKDSYIGETSGYFSKVSSGSSDDLGAGMEWDHIVAYYPYAESIKCARSSDNYAIDVVLPTEQTYKVDSFGNGAWPMVAVSKDNDITFKNVCGGMKLQLKGTQKVVAIKLEGKNKEKLSGAATVTAYTDGETKPAITMASGASTSVTLNCGSGVQLNESTATEFIIALPPVLFSKGFTVTVTDAADKTYIVETDKANTVLRSSLVNMPPVLLGESGGNEPEGDLFPVDSVKLNHTSLVLPTRFSYTLTAKITPIDATDRTPEWSSDNPTVVTVDRSGVITTMSAGIANITAVAGGVIGSCSITVIAPTTREPIDYEVGGVNYGKGIVIGDVIWAPVNCGYEPANGDYKGYPYGKLYQWGRKYGQGYSTDYDATVPEIIEGPISVVGGQQEIYSNTFFNVTEPPYNWTSLQNDKLWNSGTEENPVKTEYDPCPKGWRVPTQAELDKLNNNYSSWLTVEGQKGYYFSGDYTYFDDAPKVFLPAAGNRGGTDGQVRGTSSNGYYRSSSPGNAYAHYLNFLNGSVRMRNGGRALGFSVRCVQDNRFEDTTPSESEGDIVPVDAVNLNHASLVLPTRFSYTLTAKIIPIDATDQSLEWRSDNSAVVTVDRSGVITTMAAGTANITAEAGGVTGTCSITVIAPTTREPIDYEVDGVSYGKGIVIGDVIWAPVNCGYEPSNGDYKGYPYGKLYQWGRKYGQGYSTDYDATAPEIIEGPIAVAGGQQEIYSNTFFKVTESPQDWTSPRDNKLWNSGTEENPVKTEYDPCPKGWRVPTYAELDKLINNYSSWLTVDGQEGRYFTGDYTYLDNAPQVFFPAAGFRLYTAGDARDRGNSGLYWSSRPYNNLAYRLIFGSSNGMGINSRAYGDSVRCVQE